jgi:dimethylamine/trimethylamine dehydrogenase
MTRDSRYDVLFEPVRLGPVVTKNRFYQVPHCNGMGHAHPSALAAMRAVKAEGGWGVVSTEEVEIGPETDLAPFVEGRLWDDDDRAALARMTEAVHAHGALAAIELTFNGYAAPNRYSREIPLAPSNTPVRAYDPIQARAVDLDDIRRIREMHRAAALRARDAGFDIIYVYAGHELSLAHHFLSKRHNRRTDLYGGTLENRVRFLRELIEDTKDAVGDRCAVAVRLAVDELRGPDEWSASGEARDTIGMLAELPDLWDVNIADWANDSATARFTDEGFQERYVGFVKSLTTKPVVGVGRFTSPDAMVSQIRRGVLDLIGAARPSIADPFLPKKIEDGRIDEIRECIGCNMCVTGDDLSVPLRCTQNPTMGEEWRRGWHPERIAPTRRRSTVLVVGGGPAGLECARALAQRGDDVTLVEAARVLGGRVVRESRLPGLATYGRVSQYRIQALTRSPNVSVLLDNRVNVNDVLEFGAEHIVIATGARWRRDGTGRALKSPVPGLEHIAVYTPDDAADVDWRPGSRVLVYDDDHHYLGSVLAELLRAKGTDVVFVTPAPDVSHWTHHTLEQHAVHRRLLELGVEIRTHQRLHAVGQRIETACVFTDRLRQVDADAILLVTAREPQLALYDALETQRSRFDELGVRAMARVGDCLAPGTIAAAVYSGHKFARELGEEGARPFRRERIALGE